MKSSFTIILSFLLVTAIFAPSVISLVGANGTINLVMELNEEENKNKKEEKKEINEKDFLFHYNFGAHSIKHLEKSSTHSIYVEVAYANTLDIFLPPPEHIA